MTEVHAESVRRGGPPTGEAAASLFRQRRYFALTLVAPAALVLILFQVLPILMGVDASLRRFSLTDEEHPFIGLRNFQRILSDSQFLGVVLPNTFFFMFASVAGGVVLGLGIAMLLNRPFPGRTVVRTLIIFPLMVAPVVASIMIAWIFNDQFGVANAIITTLGFPPVAWLVKPWLSLSIVVLTDVWLQTPFYVIIILAALESLPREPFEAARVDGANAWQSFRNITLPLLRRVLLIALLFRTLDALRAFDLMFVLTGGGPASTTETLTVYAYRSLFQTLQLGFGAAVGVVVFVLVMLVAGLYLRALRRAEAAT